MNDLAHQLRACLPALADRTNEQLQQLASDPTADRCDWMIRAIAEVSTAVYRLRTELQRGEQPTV